MTLEVLPREIISILAPSCYEWICLKLTCKMLHSILGAHDTFISKLTTYFDSPFPKVSIKNVIYYIDVYTKMVYKYDCDMIPHSVYDTQSYNGYDIMMGFYETKICLARFGSYLGICLYDDYKALMITPAKDDDKEADSYLINLKKYYIDYSI